MKDYANKAYLKGMPPTAKEKLERAIGYLNARGINRGNPQCGHKYTNSNGQAVKATIQ
jgi:hypothetical protein